MRHMRPHVADQVRIAKAAPARAFSLGSTSTSRVDDRALDMVAFSLTARPASRGFHLKVHIRNFANSRSSPYYLFLSLPRGAKLEHSTVRLRWLSRDGSYLTPIFAGLAPRSERRFSADASARGPLFVHGSLWSEAHDRRRQLAEYGLFVGSAAEEARAVELMVVHPKHVSAATRIQESVYVRNTGTVPSRSYRLAFSPYMKIVSPSGMPLTSNDRLSLATTQLLSPLRPRQERVVRAVYTSPISYETCAARVLILFDEDLQSAVKNGYAAYTGCYVRP